MRASHRLHKQYLIERAEVARGPEWVAAHRGLLAEQLDMLAHEGVVLTDEEFEAAKREGRSLDALRIL